MTAGCHGNGGFFCSFCFWLSWPNLPLCQICLICEFEFYLNCSTNIPVTLLNTRQKELCPVWLYQVYDPHHQVSVWFFQMMIKMMTNSLNYDIHDIHIFIFLSQFWIIVNQLLILLFFCDSIPNIWKYDTFWNINKWMTNIQNVSGRFKNESWILLNVYEYL